MNYKLRKMQDKRNHLSSLKLEGETIWRAGEKVDGIFPINLSACWARPFLGPEISASLDPGAGEEPDEVLTAVKRLKTGGN